MYALPMACWLSAAAVQGLMVIAVAALQAGNFRYSQHVVCFRSGKQLPAAPIGHHACVNPDAKRRYERKGDSTLFSLVSPILAVQIHFHAALPIAFCFHGSGGN